jgi:hypothetical protein
MNLFRSAALLALSAALARGEVVTRVLADQDEDVGAGKLRTLELNLDYAPVRAVCEYSLVAGAQGVRVLLIRKEDLPRLARNLPFEPLVATPYAHRSAFSREVSAAGDYLLVLDNRLPGGTGRSTVHLHARLIYGAPETGPIQTLDPQRRRIVVGLSLGLFCALCVFAGQGLRRALKRRPASYEQ